jgi:hypothetical protein
MINLDNVLVADIETKGLLEDIEGLESDLHVLGIAYKDSNGSWKVKTTPKKEDVKKVFENPDNTIVGHNFFMFDIPSLEKIFKGIEIKATIVDSLLVAWYIEPNRIKQGRRYGLGDYGEEFGIKKPEISVWEGLSYEEYENRVIEDCKINTNTWLKHLEMLRDLYENDDKRIASLLTFLMTKGAVYKMHQDNPLTLGLKKCQEYLFLFDGLVAERVEKLKTVMPKIRVISTKTKPLKKEKIDGRLTSAWIKWEEFLIHCDLPLDSEGPIDYIKSYKEPNPQSPSQVKDYLFSKGWVPEIFNEAVNTKGEKNKVPQTKDKDKNLCKSILLLAKDTPEILELEDLSLLQHRRGYFVGFLRDKIRGDKIVANLAGFTNTLRIRHKTLVNLIKPSAPYGEYVRSLLLPPEGMVMIGSDISALESVTRNNFVYDIDREFVEAQSHPFYDAHLEIAEIANLMTSAEVFFYKWWKELRKNTNITFKEIDDVTPEDFQIILDSYKTDKERDNFHDILDKIRAQSKQVNYSALYGIGSSKLGKELKISQSKAQNMIDAYWVKNACVKVFADSCERKTVNGQMWIKNPLNNYFYSLRSDRDAFSTLNQGCGDYIFTLWQHNLMDAGVVLYGGFHDEIITCCKEEDCDRVIELLKSSMELVNIQLGLRVPVGIDYKIGENYSSVH